jgi:two-component system sensor histidine kinase TctE
VIDWSQVVRAVALDLSALIAERSIDFSIDTQAAPVQAHEWALRELSRNLLHNAIKNTPAGSSLSVVLVVDLQTAALTVRDEGPGISPALRERLFQPFVTDQQHAPGVSGSGLGLAICREIVLSLDGRIELNNRTHQGQVIGLEAIVRLPLATPASHS